MHLFAALRHLSYVHIYKLIDSIQILAQITSHSRKSEGSHDKSLLKRGHFYGMMQTGSDSDSMPIMQVFYFYQDEKNQRTLVSDRREDGQILDFIWIDTTREDCVNRVEDWKSEIEVLSGLKINEYHIKDLLNIDHPCAFDSTEDYDLVIFRKIVAPEDQIHYQDVSLQPSQSAFGLASTPISFFLNPQLLITFREPGIKIIESYIERLQNNLICQLENRDKPQRIPNSVLDLGLRLLNRMTDTYLDLRIPLTKRVEFWQKELLQGKKRFKQWHQLFQEMTLFQQIENLCEEQIDAFQELRDEIVQNYNHLMYETLRDPQDIVLVRIDDLTSHVERIQKHVARLRNAIQAAINLHFSAIANQTNENMRILAIITTIFAPLTLLTGIYGMNFTYLPGLEMREGFWIIVLLMLLCTVTLLYLFYRSRLFGGHEESIIDLLAQQHQQRTVNLFWLLDYERYNTHLKHQTRRFKRKIKNLTE